MHVSIQRVAAIVRPASLSKPAVSDFRARGVEIRTGDLNDGVESLKQTLNGADILVCVVVAWEVGSQRDIIRAAKEVGVQRVVPCDFGTPGAKGVRALFDEVRCMAPVTPAPLRLAILLLLCPTCAR